MLEPPASRIRKGRKTSYIRSPSRRRPDPSAVQIPNFKHYIAPPASPASSLDDSDNEQRDLPPTSSASNDRDSHQQHYQRRLASISAPVTASMDPPYPSQTLSSSDSSCSQQSVDPSRQIVNGPHGFVKKSVPQLTSPLSPSAISSKDHEVTSTSWHDERLQKSLNHSDTFQKRLEMQAADAIRKAEEKTMAQFEKKVKKYMEMIEAIEKRKKNDLRLIELRKKAEMEKIADHFAKEAFEQEMKDLEENQEALRQELTATRSMGVELENKCRGLASENKRLVLEIECNEQLEQDLENHRQIVEQINGVHHVFQEAHATAVEDLMQLEEDCKKEVKEKRKVQNWISNLVAMVEERCQDAGVVELVHKIDEKAKTQRALVSEVRRARNRSSKRSQRSETTTSLQQKVQKMRQQAQKEKNFVAALEAKARQSDSRAEDSKQADAALRNKHVKRKKKAPTAKETLKEGAETRAMKKSESTFNEENGTSKPKKTRTQIYNIVLDSHGKSQAVEDIKREMKVSTLSQEQEVQRSNQENVSERSKIGKSKNRRQELGLDKREDSMDKPAVIYVEEMIPIPKVNKKKKKKQNMMNEEPGVFLVDNDLSAVDEDKKRRAEKRMTESELAYAEEEKAWLDRKTREEEWLRRTELAIQDVLHVDGIEESVPIGKKTRISKGSSRRESDSKTTDKSNKKVHRRRKVIENIVNEMREIDTRQDPPAV